MNEKKQVKNELPYGESPEALLTRLSNKESFKAAKEILRKGGRLCGVRNEDHSVTAMFIDPRGGSLVVTASIDKLIAQSDCSVCGTKKKNLCAHGFAALLYDLKFEAVKEVLPNKDETLHFQGLAHHDLAELASQVDNGTVQAYLRVDVESEFPHVPAKWEKAIFQITLTSNGRDYKGNISNLRHLHFDKSSASLSLNLFSLQERQILRYMAINADSDNSKLTLDSEQTAELFHCLIGFPRFYRGNQRIIVHSEPATPVIIYSTVGHGVVRIQPALRTSDALLPLQSSKVITGRNGVWVGYKGEYWWIAAILDVVWLRGFFRNGPQDVSIDKAKQILKESMKAPIACINAQSASPTQMHPDILLDAQMTHSDELELNLRFAYDGILHNADQARLSTRDGTVNFRDNAIESSLIDRLRYFGFVQPGKNPSQFILKSADAGAMFFSKGLPILSKKYPKIHLSARVLDLARPSELRILTRYKRDSIDSIYLECFFPLDNGEILTMKMLQSFIRQKRETFVTPNGTLIRCPEPLFHFISLIQPLLMPVKGHDKQFRIIRANVPYWVVLGKSIYGAVPPELQFLNDSLNENEKKQNVVHEKLPPHLFNGDLRPYQKEGVQWIQHRFKHFFNVVLADEMGLGKTVQCLSLLASMEREKERPFLIICPTSLTENWRREAIRFVPDFKVIIAEGPMRRQIWEKATTYDLIIVSYAVVRLDVEMMSSLRFTVVVLDEAQHIKNPSTANAKVCKSLKSIHRLVLTGTPLENAAEDLWSIFDFLHPDMLGSYSSFVQQFDPLHHSQKRNNAILAQQITPFILRRRKVDVCADLPPKTTQTLYCEMNDEQSSIYQSFLETGRRQCHELSKHNLSTHFDILATLLRLRQICCHPGLLPVDLLPDSKNIVYPLASAKTDLLFELLSETLDSGHKVLLFSQFTSLLTIIRQQLDQQGIRYEYLDGSTKDRQERVDQFNNTSEISLFLLSLKAGGTGLNLTAADTVILYDPWWNPATELQAADRTHRIGQMRPVNIIKLVAKGTIEERILQLQSQKQALFDELIDDPSRDSELQKLTMEDFQFLFQ